VEEAAAFAEKVGYPVLIKASGGGGGKGMKVAWSAEELPEAFNLAKNEGRLNFGNDQVFLEKYLSHPRHIEVQVIADTHGNVAHLGERDCSLQRRHQKVLEEAPSPVLTDAQRHELGEVVTKAVKELGYRGVGTFEFLYEDGKFYFIEMNTRLQVEHPVTELITGIDLVKEQIRVAAGYPLSFSQADVVFKGHAIECRINAEHPETFIPSPGTIQQYHTPGGPGIRIDSALYAGYAIPPYYDSLVAKLIAYAPTREECLKRVEGALEEYIISGIETTIPLDKRLVKAEAVKQGHYDIHWLEKHLKS